MNAHQEAAYGGAGTARWGDLSASEEARDSVVLLPLHHELSEQDQDRVIEHLSAPARRSLSAAQPA